MKKANIVIPSIQEAHQTAEKFSLKQKTLMLAATA